MKETAYLLQAALISAWWLGLISSHSFFDAFQFEGISPNAFWSFCLPDVLLIATLSTLRAYRRVRALDYVILGAFGYAALYCLNASILTKSGLLPSGLMLLGLCYNFFLCFDQFFFRNASTNLTQNIAKTLVQIVCIWILALVVVPGIILDAFDTLMMPPVGFSFYLGLLLFLLCSLLGLMSSYFLVRDGAGTPLPLDQTNTLVVTGPYRFVRNPMAIAGIGQGIAVAIAFQSIPVLVYALLGAFIWHIVVRPIEESDMIRRFGNEYMNYRQQVSCWVPTFRKRAGEM